MSKRKSTLTRYSDIEPRRSKLVRYSTSEGVPSFDLLADERGCWYEIEESRCNTAAKLVDWVAHLSEKTWMTTDHVEQLIELVAIHHPHVRAFGC
jgi:hypothetical protein